MAIYRDYYGTGDEDRKWLLAHLKSNPADIADIKRRLSELGGLPEDRCHVSRDQKRFLRGVIAEWEKNGN